MTCKYIKYGDKPTSKHIKASEKVIEFFGSQAQAGYSLGWGRNYICQWHKGHFYLPIERAEQVEKATRGEITVFELRPDLAQICKHIPFDVYKKYNKNA